MQERIVYSFTLLIAGLAAVFLSAVAFRNRHRIAGAGTFCLLLFGCVIYAFGYIGELWAGSLRLMFIAIRIEYLGLAFIPSLWLLFTLRYAGHRPSAAIQIPLFAYSAVTWCVVATAPFHGLYYTNLHIRLDSPFPILAFGRGPWYVAHQAYVWGLLLAGDIVLLFFLRKAPRAFRAQILLVTVATVFPLAMNAIYLAGAVPYGLDIGPLSFFFSFSLFSFALFKFHFLDLMPFAREKVLEALEDGVLVLDAEGHLVDSNPAAYRIFDGTALRNGKPFAELCEKIPALAAFQGSGAKSVEFALGEGAAEGRRYRARAFPLEGREHWPLGTAILVTDITETARLVAKLDELASTDPLTGLANRRRFFEEAERVFALARRSKEGFVVCIADLDHFKDVNDSYGHAAGDAVLRAVADCFRSCLRSSDLMCRYGGEEFAVFFPACDEEEAGLALERLRERIAGLVIDAGKLLKPGCGSQGDGIRITASFGLAASTPAPEDSLEDCFEHADEALYRAKNSGRNKVCRY